MSRGEMKPSEARETLAKSLLAEMERLDPTEDWDPDLSLNENWARLDEHRRYFYRLCINAILSEENCVATALQREWGAI